MSKLVTQAILVVSFSLSGNALCISAPEYTIRELGLASGSWDAGALNDRGQVAFATTYPQTLGAASNPHDELYFFDGNSVHQVPTLGGPSAAALGINNLGVIVGCSQASDTVSTTLGLSYVMHAFRVDQDQSQDIGVPNTTWSEALAINDVGQIVGFNYTIQNTTQMFLLDPQSGYVALPDFGGDTEYPIDINSEGQILIRSSNRQIEQYGDYLYGTLDTLIYRNGSTTRLPGMGSDLVFGMAMNNRGQVTGGFAVVPGQEEHAFVWDPVNGMIDLGHPGESSGATDINDRGVVVGGVSLGNSWSSEAFVYDQEHGRRRLIDLIPPDSGWMLLDATDINNRGQIIGVGLHGGRKVFLLTPVPEADCGSLTAAAVVVMSLCRPARRNWAA
jgi:probable HAF family extracellular repeat protein